MTEKRAKDTVLAQRGRQAAIVLVVTGLFWILTTWMGARMGLDNRTRGLFDLIALAGFGYALWLTWQVWRMRSDETKSR